MSLARLRIVLRQGINRQIRRMLEAVGYRVKHLVRVRIGNLRLADLPRGHWRALTKRELESLHLRGSRDVVAAGAGRGSRRTEHASEGAEINALGYNSYEDRRL